MKIEYATVRDLQAITEVDHHIPKEMLKSSIISENVLIIKDDDQLVGLLRFNYFWDSIPFINMLFIDEHYRNKGVGTNLLLHFEKEMKLKDYRQIMTSTLANEGAQNFYRKLNYQDIGGFVLDNEPLEIILKKDL